MGCCLSTETEASPIQTKRQVSLSNDMSPIIHECSVPQTPQTINPNFTNYELMVENASI